MVVKCSIYGCTNRKDRERELEYYRIPAIITNQGSECEKLCSDRRREWLAKIGQSFENKNLNNLRVCSAHFVTGKKAALYDRTNPDWVPTVKLCGEKEIKQNADISKKRFQRAQERYRRNLEIASTSATFSESTELAPSEELVNEIALQTDMTVPMLDNIESDLQSLRTENIELKEKLQSENDRYSESEFKGNDKKVKHFTGLPKFTVLMTLFLYLKEDLPNGVKLDKFQMLMMTLMRLKMNLSTVVLAYDFNISQSLVSKIFHNVIDVMYTKMKPLLVWPSREALRKTMPLDFRKHFGLKCVVIIDCFEVFVERPSNLKARAETWSSYKHHNTVKLLIGITPQGSVSFISQAWGGRVSDKFLTEHCGFLDKLLPGDLVLADRGFDIRDSVGSMCAEVKIPAFTRGKNQLSPLDLESTRKLATSRIHVERVIGSLRQKYTILNGTLPINFVSVKDSEGLTVIDKIASVCCGLVNLCDPIVDFN